MRTFYLVVFLASFARLGSIMAQAQPAGGVAGVQLVRPGEPSFDSHVRTILGGPAEGNLAAFLPHSAVLVNGSSETVAGYAVMFQYSPTVDLPERRPDVAFHWGQDPIPPGGRS